MELKSNQKTAVNTVELEVAVSAEQLEEAVKKVFAEKSKTINVPGFRKGKAPRKIIEKMYGEGIFLEDAVNDLYPSVYQEAVEAAGIEPVDRAEVEMLTLDKDTGFTFKAVVTVKPEVTVTGYKGIKADKMIHPVTDADVDHEIHHMRERGSRLISVDDRPAKDGDIVNIDFEGFVDGVPFEGGKGDSHQLTLGSHSFIDTFEDQIIGHSIDDEFDVNVIFPEEYHAEELKAKPAIFKVKLLEIKEKELPELDDEFVKDVSEFDTLDELRADIRQKQEERNTKRSQDELENTLVEKVLEGFEAEVPEVMYENRIDDMLREFEQRLRSQGMNLETYLQYTGMDLENFRKTFREQAEQQVKIRLSLERIAELEAIEVTEEDFDAEYVKIAESYQMEAEQLKKMIPADELRKDIASSKAIDLVRDSAEVTEKEAEPEAHDHEH
jgi:trigger factor